MGRDTRAVGWLLWAALAPACDATVRQEDPALDTSSASPSAQAGSGSGGGEDGTGSGTETTTGTGGSGGSLEAPPPCELASIADGTVVGSTGDAIAIARQDEGSFELLTWSPASGPRSSARFTGNVRVAHGTERGFAFVHEDGPRMVVAIDEGARERLRIEAPPFVRDVLLGATELFWTSGGHFGDGPGGFVEGYLASVRLDDGSVTTWTTTATSDHERLIEIPGAVVSTSPFGLGISEIIARTFTTVGTDRHRAIAVDGGGYVADREVRDRPTTFALFTAAAMSAPHVPLVEWGSETGEARGLAATETAVLVAFAVGAHGAWGEGALARVDRATAGVTVLLDGLGQLPPQRMATLDGTLYFTRYQDDRPRVVAVPVDCVP